jgi:hypothetical protein
MTSNTCSDAKVRPGDQFFVHRQNCDGSSTDPLYTTNVNTLVSTQISPDASSGPGTQGFMFDGVRYVAWGWHGDSEPNGDRIYLYDIQNPSPPTTPVYPEAYRQVGGVISQGRIYSTTGVLSFTEGWDIWYYEIASGNSGWLDHSLWDQYDVAVDGYVAAYGDTEALGAPLADTNVSHLEIKDLETALTRQISILPGNYWQLAISGHYLAFIRGNPTKELFVCDLLEGGFMDADGHVCPLEGCPGPDAGPDAGPDGGK